jgi:bacterioferritin (cytochrome b1)
MAISKYVDYFLHNKYAETFLYGKLNDSNKKEAEEETIDAAKLKDIQNDINRIARKKKSPEKHRWVHCESLYEG